jgi:hypothetical protein
MPGDGELGMAFAAFIERNKNEAISRRSAHTRPFFAAMTPTWTLLLLVFVFWTYPACAAVIAYRIHGSSMENVKAAFETSLSEASKALGLEAMSLNMPDLGALKLRFRPEA